MYDERVQEEERFANFKFAGIRYYNHPDGEDLLGKLSFALKWSTIIGILGTTFFNKSHLNLSLKGKTVKVLEVLLPCIGMSTAFTCVTFYATRLRKKDDELNYVLGGAAAGALLGACYGSIPGAASGALLLGTAGFCQKYSKLRGETIFSSPQQKQFSPYVRRFFGSPPLPADKFPPTWTK